MPADSSATPSSQHQTEVPSHRESQTTQDSGTVATTSTKACEFEEFEYMTTYPFCPGCCEDWLVSAAAYDEGIERGRERERERERAERERAERERAERERAERERAEREREELRAESQRPREWMVFWSGLG
ncbi:uncharacterized protein RCC_00066 [Ramularia collo-cygni]|uniref:Uncharacterized protein n=1 Tax=Ramularia collo-cygni TaxID=112498 RepID=A0A2D3ULQ4_9PEZI|nr:uncharacterized protein RCC_00066 [Ramularia collo-cygni]CZT14091.1 uncharacterized protein RCC_00066 [Ramularia collo-cygni]